MNLGAYDLVAAPEAFRQTFGGVPSTVRILALLAYVVLGPTVLGLWFMWDKTKDVRRRAIDPALWIVVFGGMTFFCILVYFE